MLAPHNWWKNSMHLFYTTVVKRGRGKFTMVDMAIKIKNHRQSNGSGTNEQHSHISL